jgi:hypothetical protein
LQTAVNDKGWRAENHSFKGGKKEKQKKEKEKQDGKTLSFFSSGDYISRVNISAPP